MDGVTTIELLRGFVLLLGATAAVSLVARRFTIPYTVALVGFGLIAGAISGAASGATSIEIPSELVLSVLLPGLIFEAAYHIEFRQLRSSLLAVALLAGPGVVIVALLVAAILSAAAGIDPAIGFVAGAIVAATDPAAVIAAFKRLAAPRRLSTLVEAESVFNDGTGIVLFTIAVTALTDPIGPLEGIARFALIIAASSVIGVAAGIAASRLIVRVGDHLIELTISLVLAYGCALAAEAVHLSGIIAAATAGLTLGNYGRRIGLGRHTIEALDTVWEFLAFLLTALVFLLVGLAIPIGVLVGDLWSIGWGIIAVLVGRVLIVYLLVGGLGRILGGRFGSGVPGPWRHVVFWSGLRGAVSVALALALPQDFPERALVQEIVFGIVLFTIGVQATTIDELLARLRIGPASTSTGSGASASS